MRNGATILTLFGLTLTLLACGCVKNSVVTTELSEPLQTPVPFRLGSISDLLPGTVEPGDKPSAEDIDKFKRYLGEELAKSDLGFRAVESGGAAYEVTGGVTQYRKGSGAMRFFFGFGAGTARSVVELKLVRIADGQIAFGGNFEGTVTSWAETGDAMFRQIAHDFATQLEKQQKARTKGN